MDESVITSLQLGDAAQMGVWALIMQADAVVKGVMLILLLASIWCWAVIFDKTVRLRRLKSRCSAFERAFWSGAPLDELHRGLGKRADHPMAMMFLAAMEEWRDAPEPRGPGDRESLVERVGRVMDLTSDREVSALERHIPSLATIGSTAPFVGLLGTVWGIMNSFQAIALTHNTTLAVVAPGIAEALLATAMGLAAAIPAVVAYNKLSGEINGLAGRFQSFTDEFSVVLGRELEASSRAA